MLDTVRQHLPLCPHLEKIRETPGEGAGFIEEAVSDSAWWVGFLVLRADFIFAGRWYPLGQSLVLLGLTSLRPWADARRGPQNVSFQIEK